MLLGAFRLLFTIISANIVFAYATFLFIGYISPNHHATALNLIGSFTLCLLGGFALETLLPRMRHEGTPPITPPRYVMGSLVLSLLFGAMVFGIATVIVMGV